jgi:hypothetical protein
VTMVRNSFANTVEQHTVARTRIVEKRDLHRRRDSKNCAVRWSTLCTKTRS